MKYLYHAHVISVKYSFISLEYLRMRDDAKKKKSILLKIR